MGRNPLKNLMVMLLRNRALGRPAIFLCKRIGLAKLGSKIAVNCGFIPDIVDVEIPKKLAARGRFSMHSLGGLDQVARTMWFIDWDGYEKPYPDLFAACSRDAGCVLDVGSYSGFYSLLAANCNETSQIFAFEPYPTARKWLEKNIAVNGLSDRIRVVPSAVSDEVGEADLYVPTTVTGWMETASSLDGKFTREHSEVLKVAVVSLDEFKRTSGCRQIDLMKLDVEACEHRVLGGAQTIFENDRPIIFLEILSSNRHTDVLETIRKKARYLDGVLHTEGIDWREHTAWVDQHKDHANDHVFCPEEKKDRLEEIVRSLGYKVSRMKFQG